MKEEKEDKRESAEEIAKRYGVDLVKLEKEQEKLAKSLEIKDAIDFSQVTRVAGISNIFFKNKIISTIVMLDNNLEVLEQKYFSEKARFPYIPGFRAYRELPTMLACFEELEEKPEVVFISGHGISHSRLGLASHFSIVSGVPTIGIADSLVVGEVKDGDVEYNKKIVGKVLALKVGSKPVYISPGNLITLKSSIDLVKQFTKGPHKLPEPLRLAHKYARDIMKETSE